ncbi:MAG: hypothetical protein IM584_08050 [Chitinophagaceae bacterium]|nr:hypothetical protein [Chitinophagaceae bacterium]MEA3427092.1 hypothetical protein [Bacteroidota bacterium]MCA6452069.1 hypothetical protein [Chitinophagaceae bacterium]MCA6456069.1 hypothetical protein [Chitinophagaceae bacterium]MCA6458161.1 hypothetical protein [Chitinophagaceae bacterium]
MNLRLGLVYIGVLLFTSAGLFAQGYQALHGSAYAGSTAIFNNPAASVNTAFKWDLTLFSVQAKMSTNSAFIRNNQGTRELSLLEGRSSKFFHTNADLSLFNLLYKPDNNKAFNAGIRARTYAHSKMMPFSYSDTINSLHSFLVANNTLPFVQGFVTQSGWLEADLNYSQVLHEDSRSRLTAGITFQIMKGLSGAFAKLNKVSYFESKNGTDTVYSLTDGSGSMGYSANYDESTFKDFLKKSHSGMGLSMGIEYLTYNSETTAGTGNNVLNYDWKIGLSLMDLGANRFTPGTSSVQLFGPNFAITDVSIDRKLSGAQTLQAFKDSLRTIFTNSADITESFTIANPTRLILNIDRNLGNHFYINGELNMNFFSSASYTKLRTRELNLLTITPRWETLNLGAYLPVQYNTQGQLWVGMAIKAGPLVVGLHNLGLLKKNPMLNGGGYLMLSIHPFSKKKLKDYLDCME